MNSVIADLYDQFGFFLLIIYKQKDGWNIRRKKWVLKFFSININEYRTHAIKNNFPHSKHFLT